ncbi:MAG: hypothetical protein AB7G44_03540 [Bacteroidia bacterium]
MSKSEKYETATKRIKELMEEREALESQLEQVNSRLARTKLFAPEYDKVLTERNNIKWKIAIINIKITNRKNKLPENGYDIGTVSIPTTEPRRFL